MAVDEQDGPSKGWTWTDAKKPAIADPELGAHPEARMSARAPDFIPGRISPQALPPEMADEMGQRKVVGPGVEKFMREPLARPTGVDALDAFFSPASLALMAPSAISAAKTAVSGLVENVGAPVTRKLITLVTPSFIKKPAEAIDLLNEIANAVRREAPTPPPTAPAPPPAAMPAEAPSTAHLDRSVPVRASELTQAELLDRIKNGSGTPAVMQGRGRMGVAQPSAPIAPAEAAPAVEAPPVKNVAEALNDVAQEAKSSKVELKLSEMLDASKLYRDGMSKDEAIATVLLKRGMPSNAEAAEVIAKKLERPPSPYKPREFVPNQKARNEVAIAARRAGTKLSDELFLKAVDLAASGTSAADAVAQVLR